jgi:hypothetical protein
MVEINALLRGTMEKSFLEEDLRGTEDTEVFFNAFLCDLCASLW